jgi:hypothetical protein
MFEAVGRVSSPILLPRLCLLELSGPGEHAQKDSEGFPEKFGFRTEIGIHRAPGCEPDPGCLPQTNRHYRKGEAGLPAFRPELLNKERCDVRWIIHPEVRREEKALEFCRGFAAIFDTSKLDWVRLDLGRGRLSGAYGRCWYPVKGPQPKGYRISIQVPGPFPYRHRRYVKPIYRNSDGSWPPTPENAEPAGYVGAHRNGVLHC